jgi:hypothetical protein
MANFAVIKDNVVTNVIVAENCEDAEQATGLTCIEYTDESPAAIGWTFNGDTFDRPVSVAIDSPPVAIDLPPIE